MCAENEEYLVSNINNLSCRHPLHETPLVHFTLLLVVLLLIPVLLCVKLPTTLTATTKSIHSIQTNHKYTCIHIYIGTIYKTIWLLDMLLTSFNFASSYASSFHTTFILHNTQYSYDCGITVAPSISVHLYVCDIVQLLPIVYNINISNMAVIKTTLFALCVLAFKSSSLRPHKCY